MRVELVVRSGGVAGSWLEMYFGRGVDLVNGPVPNGTAVSAAWSYGIREMKAYSLAAMRAEADVEGDRALTRARDSFRIRVELRRWLFGVRRTPVGRTRESMC